MPGRSSHRGRLSRWALSRWALSRWALSVLLLAAVLPPAAAAAQAGLAAAVKSAGSQLQRSWASDPASAALPFPTIRLLPEGVGVDDSCSPGSPARTPAATALYCARSGELLLDQELLSAARRRKPFAAAATPYWIATALAERLLLRDGDEGRSAAANLRANCLAGVLLGASEAGRTAADRLALLQVARSAYGDSQRRAMGSAAQRGYALLSGLGSTASSCSVAEISALLQGTVADPALLEQLERLPPAERAHSSLMGAINSQCRERLPRWPCPRRLPPAPPRR